MIKISYRWLQDLIDLPESPEEVKELLTFLGFEVEDMHHIPAVPESVYAAKVLALKPHPNADKLRLVDVALAGEVKTIVCGAPNVDVGQWVPLATIGAKIGDITLSSKPIRGVVSEGMICSERELGRSEDHSGIWVLGTSDDGEWEAGEPLDKRIPGDTVFSIEVTLNRPDCLSHLGIARELAAKLNRKVTLAPTPIDEIDLPASHEVKIDIENPDGCPRYRARIMRGVDAKRESPFWVRERLKRMGTRSISAVVDATNYVMFEVGHPLHAFDRKFLNGNLIGARAAVEGEEFVTLDGETRKLMTGDVLIKDASHAVALGGVMGGLNSEIRPETTDVLLEAAYFNPVAIRTTAKRLAMMTESSKRFERGADPDGVVYALDRVTSMIQMLAGGEVYHGVAESYPQPVTREPVSVRLSRLHTILGYNSISLPETEQLLNRLQLPTLEKSDSSITVSIPSWRHDLTREIDLIEEVGRLAGYENIPAAHSANVPLTITQFPGWEARQRWNAWARNLGLTEIVSNTMVDPADLEVLGIGAGAVTIANPIAPELSCLRTNLLISLVQAAAHNLRHGRESVQLFEIGRVFGAGLIPSETLERWHIGFALAGAADTIWWRNGKPRTVDAIDITGICERIRELGIDSLRWEPYDTLGVLDEAFQLFSNDQLIGFAGRISGAARKENLASSTGAVAKRFDLDKPLWVMELNAEAIPETLSTIRFQPFTRFPSAMRDLSFLLTESHSAGALLEAIFNQIGQPGFAVDASIFDRHEDKATKQVSLGIRLRMQASDRTLTEQEISKVVSDAVAAATKFSGVQLRG